jgi:two-component system phosphate regulon sensor histidine kinase PhoR
MPFWAVFPFLELYLPPEGILATKTNLKIQLWISVGSAALMGCLLYLVVTLIWGITRELRAIQTKNDFLTKVSHELKTPLTVIMLYNETMLSDESMDLQKRRDCHKIIAREGERLKRLIDNLLHLSKHGKTKHSYNMKPGDLSEIVEKTVRACADWLETKGLDITIDLAQYLPPVQFDPEKITQALMNLLDNARKYSGQTEKIDIRTYCDGSCVILEVRDYGPGIPEEERKNIFEKYYRAIETKGESGTGLGLYIVREIVQAHGGTVEATTATPRGTIFRLSFPS